MFWMPSTVCLLVTPNALSCVSNNAVAAWAFSPAPMMVATAVPTPTSPAAAATPSGPRPPSTLLMLPPRSLNAPAILLVCFPDDADTRWKLASTLPAMPSMSRLILSIMRTRSSAFPVNLTARVVLALAIVRSYDLIVMADDCVQFFSGQFRDFPRPDAVVEEPRFPPVSAGVEASSASVVGGPTSSISCPSGSSSISSNEMSGLFSSNRRLNVAMAMTTSTLAVFSSEPASGLTPE